MTSNKEPCFACGGRFPKSDGPTHAYMQSTPGCWAAYGEVLAREYQDPGLFAACHRFTVDAYALQHPGDVADRRAIQSVRVHCAALLLVFDEHRSFGDAKAAMTRVAGRDLPPPPDCPRRFAVTVQDIAGKGLSDHRTEVERWARCAFEAWAHLRTPTRELLDSI